MSPGPFTSAEALLAALHGESLRQLVGELSAAVGGQPDAPVPPALAEAASRAPEAIARALLSRPELRGWMPLLRVVAAHADDGARGFLHRHVFPALHGSGSEIEALYHAVTLTDAGARRDWLARLDAARHDPEALAALTAEVRPEPPPGHEVVSWHVGSGKTSRVAVLRRVDDGARLAWKLAADDGPAPQRDLALQVERSREWTRLGVSTAPATWAPDGRTLLQPYVEGPSLRSMMRDEPGVLGFADDPRTRALSALLTRLVAARTFVSGLNAENLIFDGSAFQVIDSGDVRTQPTPRRAWFRTRLACRRKWTRGDDVSHAATIAAFLETTEAALPREHRLSPWLRLVSAVRLARRGS